MNVEKARKWDVELDTQRGCDYIGVSSMKEFNREEQLENLNQMVKNRLNNKQLDDLQWAKEFKEFMDGYERKHKIVKDRK